jgi:hypothetical protein
MRGGAAIRGGDAMRGGGEKCGTAAGRAGAAGTGGFGLFCCAAAWVNVNDNEVAPTSMATARRANIITSSLNRRSLRLNKTGVSLTFIKPWRHSANSVSIFGRYRCVDELLQANRAEAARRPSSRSPGPSPPRGYPCGELG